MRMSNAPLHDSFSHRFPRTVGTTNPTFDIYTVMKFTPFQYLPQSIHAIPPCTYRNNFLPWLNKTLPHIPYTPSIYQVPYTSCSSPLSLSYPSQSPCTPSSYS